MLKLPVKYPIVDENIDLSEYAKKSDVDALDASLDNKADKKEVEKISSQLDTIANKGTTVEVLERVTKEEIERQIQDGTIANLTLADESIESNKYKNKSIGLLKLDSDVIGKSYLVDKTGSWAYTVLPVNKKFNSESIMKFKINPLVDFTLQVKLKTDKGSLEKQFPLKKGKEQDIEVKLSITESRTLTAMQFQVFSESVSAKFNAELLDIQLFLDGERTSFQEPSDSNGITKIEDKDFILASKKFVKEYTDKLQVHYNALNEDIVGNCFYVHKISTYPGIKFNLSLKIYKGQRVQLIYKAKIIEGNTGHYCTFNYGGSYSTLQCHRTEIGKVQEVKSNVIEFSGDKTITTVAIAKDSNNPNTICHQYIYDPCVVVDGVRYPLTEDMLVDDSDALILQSIKEEFPILASKKYVTEEINKLNISDKLDRNELINKTVKGYRVNIRQTSYGTGIAFGFDGGNDIKYVKDDKITVNFRCRYQYFSDDGGLGLYNTSNTCLIYFGQFKNNKNTIGYLGHYNASVTATGTGYIKDLRFSVYKKLDFEIQDIYVKINDKVYYPKRLIYPETTIVEETPLVVDDNSIATKSFVEDLIGGIHKQDFELPFVNNIYTVKSSKNFFGVPIFLDYLYGKFHGTDRIIFDTDNDRQYVYPLRSLNKSMVNTKVDYKVKSETLNVPNVKFNHICIDENLNTDNIRLLIIGDSVTAGAITKQQYWSVCAEYFAKEDIIKNRDSKFMCLGSNNFRTTTVNLNSKTKEVTAGACGISSWSLNSWLTNVSNTTNYDNPGGLNGFTYVENGVTKFSILKWIERFRNYDDNGNKLELGNGTGTWINANNINKVKCCTPNVIYINSTHNGGTIEQHEEIINIIKQELPNCKVIVGNPMPLLGSYYPDKYVDEWIDDSMLRELPNYGGQGNYLSTRLESLKYYVKKEKEDTTNSFYFMPQVVITPTIEGYEYDLVDNGFKQMKKITTQSLPKEHPGTLTHKIWGYELYALLKYISGIEQGVTNNFDTVPLFD